MMKINKRENGLSLLELLITAVLIGFLVLALASIQRFAFHHMFASERRSKLQNEAYLILEHITKDLLQGIGDQSNSSIRVYNSAWAGNGLAVRMSNNTATPANYSDDNIAVYQYQNAQNRVQYCGGGRSIFPLTLTGLTCPSPYAWLSLSDKVTNVSFAAGHNNTTLEVNLTLRHNPNNSNITEDNPEVNLTTAIAIPAASGN